MASYERSYGTARAISGLLEVVGWIIVGVGGLLIIAAVSTMGGSRGGSFNVMLPLAPGVTLLISGLFMVMAVQLMRATVDTAEMTREILLLARHQNPDFDSALSAKPKTDTAAGSLENDPSVKTTSSEYFGYTISGSSDGSFEVAGERFATIGKAQAYVRSL